MFLRTKNINLSPIKTIEIFASKIPDVISLAQGVHSFDTPEVIKKAAHKALNRGLVAKYSLTYGLPELRETIEQKLAEENMYYDFEEEIIVTAGATEGITASLISIINDKKNEVIIFSPAYVSYREIVKVAGGKPVFVNLIENPSADSGQADGWQIDFDSLIKKINFKTAAILFCNPNNPTGTIFPKEDLLKIAELARKKKFFIISDEVYKDFIYDNSAVPFFSIAQISELRKTVIRAFSISKAYAMTGWRIGFIHGDEENIKEIIKVHDCLITCAPVISQYAAMAALDYADKEIKEFKKEYLKRRDLICGRLDELSDYFSYQKPNSSYFVFPKTLKNKDSWKFSLDLLKKSRVAVVPGIAFGPSGEGHVRMSFGRSEKDINEAFNRINKYFNK